MSEKEPKNKDDLLKALAWLVKTLGPPGSEIIKGIYASPFTGVPFTILVLAQLDPSGKLTERFLANLGTFLTQLSIAAGAALEHVGKAVSSDLQQTFNPPNPTGNAGNNTNVNGPASNPPPPPVNTTSFCLRYTGYTHSRRPVNVNRCWTSDSDRTAFLNSFYAWGITNVQKYQLKSDGSTAEGT